MRLIIDANSLIYHIYQGNNIDWRKGGEYLEMKEVLTKFLSKLESCSEMVQKNKKKNKKIKNKKYKK